MLVGGDFRQTLNVIKYAGKYETISASITKSKLWSHCRIFRLNTNMRLQHPQISEKYRKDAATFNDWLLAIGNGTIPTKQLFDDIETDWIEIPNDLLIHTTGNKKEAIIETIF